MGNQIANLVNWQPKEDNVLVEAATTSEVEGLRDAAKPSIPLSHRVGWFMIFSACTTVAVVLTRQAFNDFINRPILFTFNGSIPIEYVPFPAVTIMPSRLIDNSVIEDAVGLYGTLEEQKQMELDGKEWNHTETIKLFYLLNNICEYGTSFSNKVMSKLNIYEDSSPVFKLKSILDDISEDTNLTIVDDPLDATYMSKILPHIKKGLINCSKTFIVCSWKNDVQENCANMIYPAPTDAGYGCAFNRVPHQVLRKDDGLQSILNRRGLDHDEETLKLWENWNIDTESSLSDVSRSEDTEFSVPNVQDNAGHPYGFSYIQIFENLGESDKDEPICSTSDGIGYSITLHAPHEEPETMLSGIFIPPNHEVYVEVEAEMTMSDPNIHQLPVSIRKCYLQKENPLKYFTKYTESNCRKECVAKRIFRRCKCHQLSLSKKTETICGPSQRGCVGFTLYILRTYGLLCNALCYPPCTHVHYKAKMTSIPYRRQNLNRIKRKMGIKPSQKTSIVHIYSSSRTVVSKEQKLRYETSEVLGIVGGIWGLMLGISTMRLANIFAAIAVLVRHLRIRFPIFQHLLQKLHIVQDQVLSIEPEDEINQTDGIASLPACSSTELTDSPNVVSLENFAEEHRLFVRTPGRPIVDTYI